MFKGFINGGVRHVVVVFLFWQLSAYVDSMGNGTKPVELQCLRELPVEHLLKIRRALQLLTAESKAELMFDYGSPLPMGEVRDAVIEMRNMNRSDITALPLIGSHLK